MSCREIPRTRHRKFLWTQEEGLDVGSEEYAEMIQQERFFGGEGGFLGAMELHNVEIECYPGFRPTSTSGVAC